MSRSRLRFRLSHLMLVVLAAGLLAGGLELYRRAELPRGPVRVPARTWPPLPPPWLPESPCTTAGARVWINMDDVKAGVKAPRAKWVNRLADGSWLINDTPATPLPAGWKPWPGDPYAVLIED